jgi:Uma2 family endonuclease
MNILVLLKAGSKAGCLVLGNDQRIATGDGHYTYPDASVICGKPELTRLRGTDTLHNPSALAEVLSDSTRDYDLRERREHYQATPSVQDVPFADIEARTLRHVRRRGARWTTREATGDKEVRLACGAWVRAAEVFEGMG